MLRGAALSQLAVKAIAAGDETVLADARRIGQYAPGEAVQGAAELAGRLFHTTYMGTVNSSAETRNR
jgi:NAD+ synthase (glutamine-hydrolysing)